MNCSTSSSEYSIVLSAWHILQHHRFLLGQRSTGCILEGVARSLLIGSTLSPWKRVEGDEVLDRFFERLIGFNTGAILL